MSAFEDAYGAWRWCSFPSGSANDEVDELHADLALADVWVADTVIPYVESGIYQPAQVDVLAELTKLRERSDQLASGASPDDAQTVLAYRDYVDLLSAIYEGFLAQGAQS